MYFKLSAMGLVALLGACGGGSDGADTAPAVAKIEAQGLRYGQATTIRVEGRHLPSTLVADTGSCSSPTFTAAGTADVAMLTCQVTATGPLPVTIRTADGMVLHASTLSVPQPQVTFTTSAGTVVMELNPERAPVTVDNFLDYVGAGYYANTLFHRVILGFVVQGGGYTTGLVKKAGQRAPIALESHQGLRNTRATVAMARTNVYDSATSEFFVNLADNAALNYQDASNRGYAVFGKVVSGMDVVDAMAAAPTGIFQGVPNVPRTDITITQAQQTQ